MGARASEGSRRWDWWYWRMLEVEGLSRRARLVGHAVGLDVTEFGECTVTVAELGRRSAMSRGTAGRALRELEGRGVVRSGRRGRVTVRTFTKGDET